MGGFFNQSQTGGLPNQINQNQYSTGFSNFNNQIPQAFTTPQNKNIQNGNKKIENHDYF